MTRRYSRNDVITRRQMLALLGLGAAGTTAAATCGGLSLLLVATARKRQVPDGSANAVTQIVTATPDATATPAPPPAPLAYPLMIPRLAWGGMRPNHNARNERGFYDPETNPEGWHIYNVPLTDAYQTVVIHHSVIDEGDSVATLRDVQNAHREDRGWADVGYHYVVGQEGIVYEGRDLRVRGTHVAGFNTGSVGVCLLGDFTRIEPTSQQISGAGALVEWLALRLALTHLAGHGEFNPGTQCPGTNLIPYLDTIAGQAGLQRGIEGYIPPVEQVTPAAAAACSCCGIV
ncbi:MAG: peptidoglycan recognition family protein [Chloroflexota bacterium]